MFHLQVFGYVCYTHDIKGTGGSGDTRHSLLPTVNYILEHVIAALDAS